MTDAIPEERWLSVPGFEGRYDVSDHGRVRSWQPWRGTPVPRILAPVRGSHGYEAVALRPEGVVPSTTVHRLVMLAFVGPCEDGMDVRHLDGDKTNNTLMNLEYGTRSENHHDAVMHGTHHNAAKTHCPRGHRYDSTDKHGWRHCRTCRAETNRAYRTRLKGAAT